MSRERYQLCIAACNTCADACDFNLAYIGSDFNYPHNEKFDLEYVKRLYDYAYQLSVMARA